MRKFLFHLIIHTVVGWGVCLNPHSTFRTFTTVLYVPRELDNRQTEERKKKKREEGVKRKGNGQILLDLVEGITEVTMKLEADSQILAH